MDSPCPAVTCRPFVKSDLRPLSDVLISRYGWSLFDFKIRMDMAARVSGDIRLARFPNSGTCRSYIRSMKRHRRWLGLDHKTYVDEIIQPGDPIVFEKTGFDYLARRGWFELWNAPPTGLPSVDLSSETTDESIFDTVALVTRLGDFDLTVTASEKHWRINLGVLSYTANVYLK